MKSNGNKMKDSNLTTFLKKKLSRNEKTIQNLASNLNSGDFEIIKKEFLNQ